VPVESLLYPSHRALYMPQQEGLRDGRRHQSMCVHVHQRQAMLLHLFQRESIAVSVMAHPFSCCRTCELLLQRLQSKQRALMQALSQYGDVLRLKHHRLLPSHRALRAETLIEACSSYKAMMRLTAQHLLHAPVLLQPPLSCEDSAWTECCFEV